MCAAIFTRIFPRNAPPLSTGLNTYLATHSAWGAIALPVRSRLYVRQIDVPKLAAKHGWEFRTKHALAVELITWLVTTLRAMKCLSPVWVAMDGAYAARPCLRPLLQLGVTVVSRLRRDAKLFDLPPERQPQQRGAPRKYGNHRIDLAKRAGQRRGWTSLTYPCRGQEVARQYKTFLATTMLIGGPIRVVIIKYDDGNWAPYFCTDATATPLDILTAVTDRWAIEEHFHDVKEVCGAGQQQVRNVWSNLGCWQLGQWLFTLVELASWDRPATSLIDRADRPWDNQHRRPSHADRRRAITQEMLHEEFLQALPATPDLLQFRDRLQSLIKLCL